MNFLKSLNKNLLVVVMSFLSISSFVKAEETQTLEVLKTLQKDLKTLEKARQRANSNELEQVIPDTGKKFAQDWGTKTETTKTKEIPETEARVAEWTNPRVVLIYTLSFSTVRSRPSTISMPIFRARKVCSK